ncbi:MAG: glycerol-3-phosphate 1-O-acyltransferase PlsY [Erysipelotrichales bacterium]|nr:glycerol-3-phosphate 1-O-acyltransferase PlsY [Erysipelotrichales bacterium]
MTTFEIVIIYIATLLICYLIGAIPNGLILGKIFKHVDIRESGSHNTGGTNAGRVLGAKFGIITIILDALKIVIPFWLIKLILGNVQGLENHVTNLQYIALMIACLAHCFSVYIRFRGGKAVATFLGCLLATNYILLIAFALIFAIVLLISKYVSLSSMIGAVCTAVLAFILFIINHDIFGTWPHLESSPLLVLAIAFNSILLIVRHKENIKRLANKSESKVKWLK